MCLRAKKQPIILKKHSNTEERNNFLFLLFEIGLAIYRTCNPWSVSRLSLHLSQSHSMSCPHLKVKPIEHILLKLSFFLGLKTSPNSLDHQALFPH